MIANMKRISELLETTSGVRREKMGVLREAIRRGAYHIKTEDIARKILNEWFFRPAQTRNSHKYRGYNKHENAN